MPDRQDGERQPGIFKRFVLLRTVISRLKMNDVRKKRIIYSFYNYAIVKINFSIIDPLNPNEIAQVVDDALDFFFFFIMMSVCEA